MTTILTKKKDTTGAPAPGDLTNGAGGAELAVNTFDKRLYTKDSGGNVVEVGTNPTELQIDNINVNGNTITSTNTDGNIDLTPNGTGEVNITKVDIDSGTIDNTTIGGATPAAGNFTTVDATNVEVTNIKAKDGTAAGSIADATGVVTFASTVLTTTDINGGSVDAVTLGTNSPVTEAQIDNVNINGNTISSTDTDGDLVLTPNGAGDLVLDGLNWPQADGTLNQALTTNGSGQLAWSTVAGSPGGSDTQIQYNSGGSFAGASGLVTDGSNLTINAQGDLRFADSDSSNWVAFQAPATVASNVTWTLPDADGTDGQVIKTNGTGTLSWITPAAGGGGGGTSVTVTQATATAAQTDFSVTYTVGQLSVYLNGALLASADYTASNGTTVVLAAGAAVNDIFTAVAYSTVAGLDIESATPFLTAVGSGAGAVNTGVNNVFVGFEAGNDNTSGTDNTALGFRSLDVNITGANNTALGSNALGANTVSNNTGIGYNALAVNTTGLENVAVGYQALDANTTGGGNTAVGFNALTTSTTGIRNTAVGAYALQANTTGSDNAAFGAHLSNNWAPLFSNTTGSNNVAFGSGALPKNTTASNNTAIGVGSLFENTTGADNVAVGYAALDANTTGAQQVAIGRDALGANTTGTQNTALGYIALSSNTTGINNVGLGRFAGYQGTTGSGNTTINPLTSTDSYSPTFNITTESNRFVAGHTSVTNAYVQVAWTVTSDARDKTNFAPVPHGLNFVNQLEPVAFQFRVSRDSDEAHGNKRYGFKAQDILALEGDDPVIIDNEVPEKLKYQGEALVPVLVNAIKELSAQVTALQAEVNTLKGQ